MKRCPTCQRTFSDEGLSFCTEDGTPLARVEADETTQVKPDPRNEELKAPAYQPPVSPSQTQTPQGKNAPWILVIIVALVLGIVVAGIVLLLIIPRRANNRVAVNRPSANTSTTPGSDQPVHTGTPTNENSIQVHESSPPADKDQVLTDLTAIENEWTIANLNADKDKLEQILADDYVGSATGGRVQGKAEYIDTIERDTTIEKWNFEDLQLTLRGDRATLSGKIRLFSGNNQQVLNFTDRFVWRDGRWQATGSEVSPVQ